MQSEQWLPLTDYSSKYRVSMSTLRRRIKSGQIHFRLENGKYFVSDHPPQEAGDAEVSSQMGQLKFQPKTDAVHSPITGMAAPLIDDGSRVQSPNKIDAEEEPLISTATKLLNELKKAYSSILQEKEEQMIQLKAEVADLKTLVRVLEEDNDRMRAILQHIK